jgi:preprotein translocase subunit SecE
MRKVTTPSLKEVQSTTIVVIVAVFIFGAYFFIIDSVITRGVDLLFRAFSK